MQLEWCEAYKNAFFSYFHGNIECKVKMIVLPIQQEKIDKMDQKRIEIDQDGQKWFIKCIFIKI